MTWGKMSQRIKLWQIDKDDKPIEVNVKSFAVTNIEDRLESWIEKTPNILGEKLLIIDRQHVLPNGEKVDLLAVDGDGKLVIIELKREKPRREAIAQALDYETWLSDIKEEEIDNAASTYFKKKGIKWGSLREAFEDNFGKREVVFNNARRTFIVAPNLDADTEKIINYLSLEYKMDINGVTFAYHKDENGRELIIRSVVVSPEVIRTRTLPPLKYHLDRISLKNVKTLYLAIFEYFQKQNYRLHSTKHYITIYLKELEVAWIRPRKTMAHITIYADYYKPEDIQRLAKLSEVDANFNVNYDEKWVTKRGEKIVSSIEVRGLQNLKMFKKYEEEIKKAIESNIDYEESYEKLDKDRKEARARALL